MLYKGCNGFIPLLIISGMVVSSTNIDGDTLRWWFEPDSNHTPSFFENVIPLSKAISLLNDFCKNAKYVWSYSSS